jgi:uncharacterized protein DUF5679
MPQLLANSNGGRYQPITKPLDITGEERDPTQPPQGYCVVCKAKREVSDAKQIERGGGPAIEGKCAVCGGKIFVMGVV